MLEIQLPKRVSENIARFTGRTWLLPKILEWWDRSDERLFLLSGSPGSGKSMIIAWLAGVGPEPEDQTAKSQLARVREVVKAAHFCQADSRNITPQAFADNVANQLTRTLRGFGDALAATLAERVQIVGTASAGVAESGATLTGNTIGQIDLATLGDELSFDRAFTEPLRKLYENGHGEPMLVLVDALDEAQTYTGVTLVDLLSRLSDLPAPVRILATTRDEPRVLKFFRSVEPFDLIRNADPDVDDVRNYAELRLAGLTSVEQSKRSDFTKRLVDKANGVFLYAALVLDELITSSTSVLPDLDSYPLPDKVSGLYHAFLTRELGKNEQRWFDQYQPLLGLIAVAQGEGLTDQQLTAIIGNEITAALRVCKQYLTGALPHGPFRVFHKSFADFLLTDKENVDYHIDATTMHKRIADHYWSHKLDWSKCDDYGLNNLAAHLAAVNRIADLVTLIDHSWMRVRYERGEFSYSGFQSDIDLAWRAVGVTSRPQLEHLIYLRAAALAVQEQVKIYEDEDLAILVALERNEEAVKHARLRNTAQGRFQGFMTIYRALLLAKHPTMAMKLCSEARTAANAIGDAADRVRALCSLSRELSRTHDPGATDVLEDVKQCVNGIQDKGNRAVAEREFVSALVEATALYDAEQIAVSIDDDVQRAFALATIAIKLADSGHFGEAERLAGFIKTTWSLNKHAVQRTHAKTLAGIARALAVVDDRRAAAMFDDAERAAISIEYDYMHNEALEDVAAALIHSGRLSQAERVATGIRDWRKSSTLLRLINALARAGDFCKAEALVDSIPKVEWRSFALRDIAQELAAAGRYDEAQSIQRGLKEITTRVSALRAIARELLKKEDDRARDVLDEATKLSAAIGSPSARATAFRALARILVEARDLDRARSMFEQVHYESGVKRDNREHCAALREVAIALASVEDTHADTLIDAVSSLIESLETLWQEDEKRKFATELSRVRRFKKAWEVLESDKNDLQREGAWCELAIALARAADNRSDLAFENAQHAVQEIGNAQMRDEALAKLAAILIKESRFEMAEGVIELIKRVDYRSQALTGLALAICEDNPTRARELLTLAERTAAKEWIDNYRDDALVSLVSGLARLEEVDDALRVSSTIIEAVARVEALCRVAERLVLAGDSRGQVMLNEGLEAASSGNAGDEWPEADVLRREAARLSREGDAKKASELWVRAQDVAGSLWTGWIWGENQYRTEGMLHLASALARLNDSRADSVFDLARQTAKAIPYESARDQTLHKLVRALIEVGRLETAEIVFSDIHGDSVRLQSVRDLVEACTAAGRLDSASQLARSVPSEYYRREIMRSIAAAFARENRMTEAIQVLEEISLDGFIGSVGRIYTAWTAAPPGAVIASMRAVTKVAAWVRSDWNEIYQELMT